VREYREDRREGASQQELRADRREVRADQRELRSDHDELRQNRRDLRGDRRDFRRAVATLAETIGRTGIPACPVCQWVGQTGMSVLLCYPFELDEWAHRSDHHSFDHFHATGQSRPVVVCALSFGVIPDLAVCAVPIPAKVPVGNRVEREVLETTEQTVLLRHFHSLSHDFNSDESFVRIE